MKTSVHVGVIGAGSCDKNIFKLAQDMGHEIGQRGWTLVCGGLKGVMEGAAKGCSETGGLTIGILPGLDKTSANPYIQVPFPTGLGEGRNLLVVRASDILIAISGGYGTLSEIGLALKADKPVIGINTWQNIDGIQYAQDCQTAIRMIEQILRTRAKLYSHFEC